MERRLSSNLEFKELLMEIRKRRLKPAERLISEIKEKIGDEIFQKNFGKGAEEVLNELIEKVSLTFEDELERILRDTLNGHIIYFEEDIIKAIFDLNYIWRKESLTPKILRLYNDTFVVIVSYKDSKEDKTKIFAKAINLVTKEMWGG